MNDNRSPKETDLGNALKTLELWSLDPVVRGSVSLMDELIADDFIEYGQSGHVYSKEDVLAQVPFPTMSFEIDRFDVRSLGEEHALVLYHLIQTDTSGRSTFSNRCSIWHKEADRWRMIFHQGTRLEINDEKGKHREDNAD